MKCAKAVQLAMSAIIIASLTAACGSGGSRASNLDQTAASPTGETDTLSNTPSSSGTPAAQASASQDAQVSVSPTARASTSPAAGTTAPPTAQAAASSEARVSASPPAQASGSPAAPGSASPAARASASPVVQASTSAGKQSSASPTARASASPSARPSASPTARATATPSEARGTVEITFPFVRQDGIATNQFAVWIESAKGEFVKTVFATHFIATGGYKVRPEAIPTWVKRSDLANASSDEVDAIAGATLNTGDAKFSWNCTDREGKPVPTGSYRFYVEGTTRWENRILYEGTIEIGGKEATVEAKVSESTDEARQSGMIGQVTAVYTP